MLIVPSFLLASLFVLQVSALIRPPNKPAALIGAYLLFFTNILASLLIAAAVGGLSSRYIVLLIQLLLAGCAYAIWLRAGKPPLLGWLNPLLADLRAGWKKVLLNWPDLCLFAAGLAITFGLLAMLVVIVPPNNNDSLSTHLSRIGYWLQHNSFLPWPIFNTRPVYYPINAALQVFWTVLMWGTDRLAGFIQWAGGLATILTVFGLARLRGWSRAQSAFAALVWGSFPIILLQSSTTQLDLVAAAVFLPCLYFLILGIKSNRRTMFVMAGLSLGLALGTKQTLLFLLPGLGLFLLLQWRFWKKFPRQLAVFAASTAAFFILLSSQIYIINTVHFGHPFGPPETVASSTGGHGAQEILSSLKYNVLRLGYQFVDFSGMPGQIAEPAYQIKGKAGRWLAQWSGFSLEAPEALADGHHFEYSYQTLLNEDESWFGVLGFLLLLPAFIHQFVHGLRRKDGIRIGLGLFALAFLPVNAVLRPGWDPFQGRYFITAAAAVAPFMAVWVQPKIWSRLVRLLALILAATCMFVVLHDNPAKPLSKDKLDIFTRTRQDMQEIQGGMLGSYLNLLSQSLPSDTVVGFYSSSYIWDYPLFGERFTRTVIPLVSEEQLGDAKWLRAQGIEYIVLNLSSGLPRAVTNEMIVVDKVPGAWQLYSWKNGGP